MKNSYIEKDVKTLKANALKKITERDLWEFLVSAIGIRSHFKGHLVSFSGKESSQDLFDRKLKELFGLEFVYPPPKAKTKKAAK